MKTILIILSLLISLNMAAQKHKPTQYNPYHFRTNINWETTLLRAGSWTGIITSCYFMEDGLLKKNKPHLFGGLGGFVFAISYDFKIELYLKKKTK